MEKVVRGRKIYGREEETSVTIHLNSTVINTKLNRDLFLYNPLKPCMVLFDSECIILEKLSNF